MGAARSGAALAQSRHGGCDPRVPWYNSGKEADVNIELISHLLCPYVQRSVIQLREKGVAFEFRPVDLKNKPDWFLALSPRGKVPVLVVPNGAGETTALFESNVINEYIDETHPPRLLPEDALERARHRGFLEIANDLFSSMASVVYGKTEEQWREGREAASRALARIEKELRGDFFAGDRFGLVDVAFAPALHRFALLTEKTGVAFIEGMPKVEAWARRIVARPSVRGSVVADFAERYDAALRERGAWVVTRFR
jgi:glutathione S-transferase